ncbi:hypothetical protein SAMN04487895_10147 [Paenibacillus sophorae]|uniref:Uncharacterized protein n=1 Tax=Paenibacillus sophorae TaxID=1333845 RepID=A0A1H8FAR4_9BACL|nr:hypothetical protein [Paenibacillus sophorae]QWU13813.1 hypothetical protein KP014_17810 [Paenibacillus sophorae]SEN28660.1 hypothetical protein SAMN04487895_10147 [Paenibacillus sophorae]
MKRSNIYTTKVYRDKRINIRLVSKRLKRLKKIILFLDSNGKLRIKIHNKVNRSTRSLRKSRPTNRKKRSKHSKRKKGVIRAGAVRSITMTDIKKIVVSRDPPITNEPLVIPTNPQAAVNTIVATNPPHTMVNGQDVSLSIQQSESSTGLAERPHQQTNLHLPGEAISGSKKNMPVQIIKENTITTIPQVTTNPNVTTNPLLMPVKQQDSSLHIQQRESSTGLAEHSHQPTTIHLSPGEAISDPKQNMPIQIIKENTITTAPQAAANPNVTTNPPQMMVKQHDSSLHIQQSKSISGLAERPHQPTNIHLSPGEAISCPKKNMPIQIIKENKKNQAVTNPGTVINKPGLKSDPDTTLADSQKSHLIQSIPQEVPVVNDSPITWGRTFEAEKTSDTAAIDFLQKRKGPLHQSDSDTESADQSQLTVKRQAGRYSGSKRTDQGKAHNQKSVQTSDPRVIIPEPEAASVSHDSVLEPRIEKEPLIIKEILRADGFEQVRGNENKIVKETNKKKYTKVSTLEDVNIKITGENGNGSIRGSGRHNSNRGL